MLRPAVSSARLRSQRIRIAGVIGWSGFLAAAFATMICFAFLDPQALADGDPPVWWSTRSHVYALGFFLFWLTGLVSAALAWFLAHPLRRRVSR
jgi:phosphotransferase system  glucose/maltose/N-acetylglucosamine-specific IIC component